jgi:SAM-dependent methyltransferase
VKRCLDDAIAAITSDTDPDKSLLEALRLDSDVLDRRYEGGLKTWECALDLALFLREETRNPGALRVLELGCGSGLPSIVAAMAAAFDNGSVVGRLTLQDYNLAVLKHVTLPNCSANGIPLEKIDCIYGDWLGIDALLPVQGYDLILASETIYRPESYAVMTAIIKHALAPQGTALIAAKDYYFGLGGSVDQFTRHISTAQTGLDVALARHFDDGVARSILRITHTNPRS